MKVHYLQVTVAIAEVSAGRPVLTGSITDTELDSSKENVSVNDFKTDQTFNDNGFGDISF